MYTLRKVCPMYNGGPKVYDLVSGETEDDLLEVLRGHLLDMNERLLTIPDLPDAIRVRAEASIDHNDDMVLSLVPSGTVWIDHRCPEMDSYTITKDK
tara:strand:+ start:102 stop:392 length:291 start_codon:yes stop_codon:yes gene_type:complete